MSKAKVEERPTVLLGRPSNNVSIGIVGMPNIGKCFAPDTLIRLYDGSTLPVQHISSLTPLMGDDGLPRLVTPGSLVSGRARMYTVTPQWDGMAPFTVNGDHILVLHCNTRPSLRAEADGAYTVSWMEVSTDNSASRVEVRHATLEAAQAELAALMAQQGPLEWEVSVDDFLATSPSVSSHFHVIASAAVTFHSATQPTLAHTLTGFLGVAPSAAQEEWAAWYLGHWLTAGAADSECIELEGDAGLEGISSRVLQYQSLFGEPVSRQVTCGASSFTFGVAGTSSSVAHRLLTSYSLLANSHVPDSWLCDSVAFRHRLLAGALDGQRQVEGQVFLLAESGAIASGLKLLAASIGHRSRVEQQLDGLHRLELSGDLTTVLQHCAGSLLGRAATPSSVPEWEGRSSSFSVKAEGEGDYFGFAVHGGVNQRFLLADFTVTHNSSLFNCLSNLNVPAENYPFCTIDPSNARVPVPDERFDFLCSTFKPSSKVPAVLTITDIAGLVKGANEGKGLGNAFLSHIQAVDAIFHLVRAFKDKEIEHVEGSVDPIRDLDIISEELILKDYSRVHDRLEVVKRLVEKGQDKSKKQDVATLTIADQLLEEKKDIRSYKWKPDDIDVLNELQLLTAKPVVYLVNIGEDEYYQQKNKWLGKIKEWTVKRDPQSKVIPFSVVYEAKITAFGADEEARKAFIAEKKVPSQMPKIITTGYHALDLIHYFTAGEDEVRGWTVKRGALAPAAAGVIHTDFQKAFIAAEVMAFDDFKEAGSETAVKAAGKYRTKGKEYLVADGDIMFFKHNAGGAKKK